MGRRAELTCHVHLFMEGGRFQPEAIVAMRTAYEASLIELRDTGQPKLVLEIIAEPIIAAAGTGERDPVRLREAALPWIARAPN
jgi:hypothetical protein